MSLIFSDMTGRKLGGMQTEPAEVGSPDVINTSLWAFLAIPSPTTGWEARASSLGASLLVWGVGLSPPQCIL